MDCKNLYATKNYINKMVNGKFIFKRDMRKGDVGLK